MHQWIGRNKLNIADHTKGRASSILSFIFEKSQKTFNSSLIFLEDTKKLNFVLTRLAMVLNDSYTITEKSRTDLLVDFLDRDDGPLKNHLFIGMKMSYLFFNENNPTERKIHGGPKFGPLPPPSRESICMPSQV